MTAARVALVLAVVAAVAAFVVFDFGRFFTLSALKAELAALADYRDAHPAALAAGFFAIFVASATLALPIDLMLTVAGGALFGAIGGTMIASFGTSVGATMALLAARFLFRAAALRASSGEHRSQHARRRHLLPGRAEDGADISVRADQRRDGAHRAARAPSTG